MEIPERLLLFRLKYSWLGIKSSSGHAPAEVCQGNGGWWGWLSSSCSLHPITKTSRSVPQGHKTAKPEGWLPHQNIREKQQI